MSTVQSGTKQRVAYVAAGIAMAILVWYGAMTAGEMWLGWTP